MYVSEFLKEYLKWFIPLLAISVLFYFTIKPLSFVGLLLLIMPMDRARVKMLRNNYPIPGLRDAWKIIGISVLPPFLISSWGGFMVDLEPGQLRASAVVSFQIVFVVPVFSMSCVCFLSKSTWSRALQKYNKQSLKT